MSRPGLFVVAAACFGLAFATPAAAEPAVWVIEDADSTVYLMGTVHLLRPEMDWRTPRLKAALDSCSDLTLEIPGDDPSAVSAAVARIGYDPDGSLAAKLTEAERERLDQAAATLGLSPAALDVMRPWLAGLVLSVAPLTRAGYDPKAGVEQILREWAQARGAPVRGFETEAEQLGMLAALPEEAQLAFLRDALEEYAEAADMLDRMARAWAAGDLDAIRAEVTDEMKAESPALYEALLVRRNEGFARDVKRILDGRGVSCVAVGVAHLTGDDSVQAKLKALGISARRF